MSHPHHALLLELDIAIKKLPPTLTDLQKEAKKKLEEFGSDDTTSEEVILGYLAEMGRKEYPHRHALIDLHEQKGEGVESKMILDHLDEAVRGKVEPMMKEGVSIEELVRSDWFEDALTPAERYQVEDGLLLARYKIEQEDKGLVASNKETFEQFVEKWEAHAKEIDQALEALEELADKDSRYTDEINEHVRQFRIGWSVVERDPVLKEIKDMVASWTQSLEETP